MPSARDFRGSRRELALFFSDGPRTANDASKALGRPMGSFFGVLKRMHADGVLIADTSSPARGTRYSLAPEAREALRASIEEARAPGQVNTDQLLLVIDRPSKISQIYELFSSSSTGATIDWAAQVDGGWLLAFSPHVTDPYPVEQLQVALDQLGIGNHQMRVSALMSGGELRNRSGWLLEDSGSKP